MNEMEQFNSYPFLNQSSDMVDYCGKTAAEFGAFRFCRNSGKSNGRSGFQRLQDTFDKTSNSICN